MVALQMAGAFLMAISVTATYICGVLCSQVKLRLGCLLYAGVMFVLRKCVVLCEKGWMLYRRGTRGLSYRHPEACPKALPHW